MNDLTAALKGKTDKRNGSKGTSQQNADTKDVTSANTPSLSTHGVSRHEKTGDNSSSHSSYLLTRMISKTPPTSPTASESSMQSVSVDSTPDVELKPVVLEVTTAYDTPTAIHSPPAEHLSHPDPLPARTIAQDCTAPGDTGISNHMADVVSTPETMSEPEKQTVVLRKPRNMAANIEPSTSAQTSHDGAGAISKSV